MTATTSTSASAVRELRLDRVAVSSGCSVTFGLVGDDESRPPHNGETYDRFVARVVDTDAADVVSAAVSHITSDQGS